MKPECETRERILDTAMALIWESSYGSVSVDDICAKAGARKGSFYHFFPSKTDLTVAALERHWEAKQAKYDRIFSVQHTPRQRFENFVRHIYESQLEKQKHFGKICGCPYVAIGSELGTQDEKIRRAADLNTQRSLRYIESALRDAAAGGEIQGENLPAMARQVYSFVVGAMMQAKIANDVGALSDLNSGLFRLIGFREEALAAVQHSRA